MRSSNSKGKADSGEGFPLENGLSQAEKLPTIQIDTVPSPPCSPGSESSEPEEPFPPPPPPLEAEDIDIQLQEEQQDSVTLSEEERASVRTFVEELLAKAMVVAEKKLKFVGLDDEDEQDETNTNIQTEDTSISNHEVPSSPEPVLSEPVLSEPEPEEGLSVDQKAEIRSTAEKVVEEVLSKAQETAADKLAKERPDLDFPITFDDAPEDVKDVASSFIKEIVGKAITMAEEKAVPTVPFNFDVDLIKSSGPWYVRVREGFMRVLRSACFCTPRRNDS